MTGVNGDYYLNTITGNIFQKVSGTWVKIGNIKGPSPPIKQIEVDFGNANYITEQAFTIADSDVLSTSHIVAMLAYDVPTNKDLDEVEMDELEITCGQYAIGSFVLFVKAMEGSVYGAFKINYLIG